MRKTILAGLLLALSGVAVGQAQEEKIDGYVINGVIEGKYKADKVYLVEEDAIQGPSRIIDSCMVVNNRYTFKGGKVKFPRMYFIKSADPECLSPITPFFLENGVINIRSNASYFMNSEAKGTVNNDLYAFYNFQTKFVADSLIREFLLERKLFGERDYEYENAAFKQRSEIGTRRPFEIQKQLFERYPNQVFAPFVLYWGMKFKLPLEELKAMRAKIDPVLNDHPYVAQLDEFIKLASFGVGSMIPDITVPDQNGKTIDIRKYRGKYVLIDFWASWCGPCMREMPNVVELYKECKGKNFEIVGISLDSKKEAWLTAVKKNNMKWPQGSDLKMWESEAAKLCNVHSIPCTVLIDPDGKVVALNLRGKQLEAKVKECLGKK